MNSNSIFLTSSDIKVGSEVKLPTIIRLVQNRSDNKGYGIDDTNEENTNIVSKRKRQSGNMAGNNIGFFDFTMDFTCAPITIGGSDDPFMDINKILELKTSPTFTDSYFTKNFILLEITDYGHQAMSPGFRDFIPQVFVDGKKIWQKYIGIIRQYSKHSAYLVISKKNNLKLTEIDKEENDVKIRIVFKNNIEDKNIDINVGQLSRTLVKKSTETGYYVFTAEKISDFQYLSTSDITDYDIYDSSGNRIVTPYNEVLVSFEFTDTKDINKQNREDEDIRDGNDGIAETERFKSLEYYRQSYVHDYAESVKNVDYKQVTYQRKITLELTIKFSKSFFNFDETTELKLKSRQNSYNAVYKKSQIKEEFIPFKSYSELNFFSKSGKRIFDINSINLTDDEEIEVIPEFTNKRKTTIKASSALTEVDLRNILYTTKIYNINNYIENPEDECVVFNSDGSFESVNTSGIVTCNENSYIDIYTDFTRNISETPTTVPSIISGIEVQYNLNNYEIPEILGNTNHFKKINKNSDGTLNTLTIGTLVYIGNDIDNFNIYTICRSFPVLFEKEMIQPSIYKIKYPEWLFLDTDGKTKIEFFYSMEPKLYIQGIAEGTFYYKTDKVGSNLGKSDLPNNTYSVSGSANIINNTDSEFSKKLMVKEEE